MNAVQADKCFARRMARAGCVDALGIVRVRHAAESTRVLSPGERVQRWRERSGRAGIGNAYVWPYMRKTKKRDWNVTVPKPRTLTKQETAK